MPQVAFTSNLLRHVPCAPCTVPGATVGEALEQAFVRFPRVRGYVLDEQGQLRHHMVVFVNGVACSDRHHLSDPVGETDEVFVMQALSGG